MSNYSLLPYYSKNSCLRTNSSGGQLFKQKIGDKYIKTSVILDKGSFSHSYLYNSYAEVLAYKIAKVIGINCIEYKLCNVEIYDKDENNIMRKISETKACESKSFLRGGEYFIPFYCLIEYGYIPKTVMNKGYNQIINHLLRLGIDIRQMMSEIFILDSIILNSDRHFNNFGFIGTKTDAGLNLKVAPIFDNGESFLLNSDIDKAFKYYELIVGCKVKSKPFYSDFTSQLYLVDSKVISNLNLDSKRILDVSVSTLNSLIKQGLPEYRAEIAYDLIKSRLSVTLDTLCHNNVV